MPRRKNRELFEILKQSRRRRQHIEEEWREREQLAQAEPVIDGSPLPSSAPSFPPRLESRPTVSLRQDTCILGAIGLIFLFIITFIAGYYKGNNDARSAGQVGLDLAADVDDASSTPAVTSTPPPAAHSTRPKPAPRKPAPAKPSGAQNGTWSLQVWTGSKGKTAAARDLVAFFTGQGIDARATSSKEWITVLVGNFPSRSEPEAVKMQRRVRVLSYKGDRIFKDCYYVKGD